MKLLHRGYFEMFVEEDDHEILYTAEKDNKVKATCSCGKVWYHPNGTTVQEIEDTYQKHLKELE